MASSPCPSVRESEPSGGSVDSPHQEASRRPAAEHVQQRQSDQQRQYPRPNRLPLFVHVGIFAAEGDCGEVNIMTVGTATDLYVCQQQTNSVISANNSMIARASPARAALVARARRHAWKAYPMEKGRLGNRMLGPSQVSGCPQQNEIVSPIPRGGSTAGKASAAQPERGPRRDTSPATTPNAKRLSVSNSLASRLTIPPRQTGQTIPETIQLSEFGVLL